MRLTLITLALLAFVPKALSDPLPPDLPPAPTTGPALCPGAYLTPAQGKAAMDFALTQCPTRETWQSRTAHDKQMILQGAGLNPLPARTPLHPILSPPRQHDGYTVQNIALEILPGYYATGNLYRPLPPSGVAASAATTGTGTSVPASSKPKYPAILTPHGHGPANDPDHHPRFSTALQQRAATLARMGAVVMNIDMFAWGDQLAQVPNAAHRTPLAMPLQIWNGIRAIDYLTSLDDVDPKKIAVTGESGGGTQTMLITALDNRVAVSVPVVMPSSYFFGGCPCESGRPIHRSPTHFMTNAELAALAAPRPMLVVSDGKDWTQHTPETEFPFLQKIYALYDKQDQVANVHLPKEGHDYGPSKRTATYHFLAKHLGLDDSPETIDESHVTPEPAATLRNWTESHPLPPNALHGADAIQKALESAQAAAAQQ